MDEFEFGPPPNADEYVSFLLVGGPHNGEYTSLPYDTPYLDRFDDDGWIVRYERHTYHFGSGHNMTVFMYTGLPRKV